MNRQMQHLILLKFADTLINIRVEGANLWQITSQNLIGASGIENP